MSPFLFLIYIWFKGLPFPTEQSLRGCNPPAWKICITAFELAPMYWWQLRAALRSNQQEGNPVNPGSLPELGAHGH